MGECEGECESLTQFSTMLPPHKLFQPPPRLTQDSLQRQHLLSTNGARGAPSRESYSHSLPSHLLTSLPALGTMLQHLLLQHPGQRLSIPQLWRRFHNYLAHTPTATDILLHATATNDDLEVGFFNSGSSMRCERWSNESGHSTRGYGG